MGCGPARLTLPRSDTFIYHTHLKDLEQLTSGLFCALVVVEPGQQFDSATDHVFVAGLDAASDGPARWVVNGDTAGPPIQIVAGLGQRFRLANTVSERALRRLNVGETFDAEFTAPAAGEYELTVRVPGPKAKVYRRRLIVH